MKTTLTRRSFLRQTIAFSALTTSNVLAHGAPDLRNPDAKHAIIVGDWGWADPAQGQSQVAAAMRRYTLEQKLNSEALLLLGDSWYGDLSGGADSPRWQSGFEAMYPEDAFPNRAYTIAGNHDYATGVSTAAPAYNPPSCEEEFTVFDHAEGVPCLSSFNREPPFRDPLYVQCA